MQPYVKPRRHSPSQSRGRALRWGARARPAVAALAISMPGVASAETDSTQLPAIRLNGGASVVSDYLSRGVSLSDNGPAIQANIQATHRSGVYMSAWASTAKFDDARAEIDLTVGFGREIRGLQLDVGYVRYIYPGASVLGEVYASASGSLGNVSGKVGAYYSWDTPAGKASVYPFVEAKAQLNEGSVLTLSGHLGYFHYSHGQAAPYQNYADWNVAISARVRGLDVSLGYAATSVGAEPAGRRWAAPKVVLSVGRNF